MKRQALPLLFALSCLVVSVSVEQPLAHQQKPPPIEEEADRPAGQTTIRVGVHQINVDVTVQNKKGNLIQGLKRGHFKVYEDKVEQEITNFAPAEAPMTAVLVVEFSRYINVVLGSYYGWEVIYEAWLAAQTFVRGMREGDWIAVIAYDLRPEILVDFTQNQGEVLTALRRLSSPAYSESNLYDTVIDTLDRLEEVEGKVSIVLVTTGLDSFSKTNLGKLLKRVKNTNVTIYPIGLAGHFLARREQNLPATTRMDFQQAEATLKHIAKSTGGQAYFPRFTTAFNGIFNNISALVRSQYSLSYVSTNPKQDNKFRKLRIQVEIDVDGDGKPDKLKVSHKQGYYPSTS
jgi:VWFA-related protein